MNPSTLPMSAVHGVTSQFSCPQSQSCLQERYCYSHLGQFIYFSSNWQGPGGCPVLWGAARSVRQAPAQASAQTSPHTPLCKSRWGFGSHASAAWWPVSSSVCTNQGPLVTSDWSSLTSHWRKDLNPLTTELVHKLSPNYYPGCVSPHSAQRCAPPLPPLTHERTLSRP